MQNITKKSENTCDDVTILYPGSFKPLHAGHLNLIHKYLEQSNIKQIILFISPGSRDDIDPETSYKIAKKLIHDKRVKIILDKTSYSPILSAYRYVENKKIAKGKYALASSSKGKDYKRVKEFVKNYSTTYKHNLAQDVEIVEYSIDTTPFSIGDKIISASNIRKFIKENNFEYFKECYPNIKESIINSIWTILKTK